MRTVVITGSNRGIGLQLTEEYLKSGWIVEACCRNPLKAKELHDLRRKYPKELYIHQLELANFAEIDAFATVLISDKIDLLICNAGIYKGGGERLGNIDYKGCQESFLINTLVPIKLTEVLCPLLEKSENPRVVILSSKMGSITDNSTGGSYPYRMSKAAVNMAVKNLDIDLNTRGIIVVAVHPGWVRTDMGGEAAPLSPLESAAGIQAVVTGLRKQDSGKLLEHTTGVELPW